MRNFLLFLSVLSVVSVWGAPKSTLSLLRDAENYISLEKYSKAIPLLEEAAADTSARPIYRFNIGARLGDAYWQTGRPQPAFNAYKMAIEAGKKIANFHQVDSLIFNTAQRYADYGKFEDGINLIESSNFEPWSEPWLRASALDATLQSRQGDHYSALYILQAILDNYPKENPNRGVILQNKGYIHWQNSEFENAENNLSEAINLLEGTDKYVALSNLAMVHSDMAKFSQALSEIDEALEYFRKNGGEKSRDYIIALRKKGEVLHASGQDKEALKIFRRFAKLEKEHLLKEIPALDAQTRLDYWTMEKPLLSRALVAAHSDPEFAADLALIRHHTSLWGMHDLSTLKEDMRFDVKSLRKALPKNSVAMQLVEYEPSYGKSQYIAILTPKVGATKIIDLFTGDYVKNTSKLYPVSIEEIVTSSNKYNLNALYTDSEIDAELWGKILAALPTGTTDLFFTPESVFHLWGIEHMPSASASGIKMHRLSSMQQIANREKNNTTQITPALVAGGLKYTNFDEQDYFLDVINGEGGRSFDCEYDAYERLTDYYDIDPGTEIFSYLPGTRLEAENVATIVGDCDYRQILRENELKRIAGNYRTLHLATHGYSIAPTLGQRPKYITSDVAIDVSLLYSGVALTDANNVGGLYRGQDGILSAREICNLDLSGVDLVVLSACETARASVVDEGVCGLVRALKMAGVKTIIASLWEVDDTSTSLFMAEFYRNLKSGCSKKDAFDAAVDYIKNYTNKFTPRSYDAGRMARKHSKGNNGKEITSQPYKYPTYYAPFILIDGIN